MTSSGPASYRLGLLHQRMKQISIWNPETRAGTVVVDVIDSDAPRNASEVEPWHILSFRVNEREKVETILQHYNASRNSKAGYPFQLGFPAIRNSVELKDLDQFRDGRIVLESHPVSGGTSSRTLSDPSPSVSIHSRQATQAAITRKDPSASELTQPIVDRWPAEYRLLIARYIAVKLMEINNKDISHIRIRGFLDCNPTYGGLLSNIVDTLGLRCPMDSTIAEFVVSRAPERGTRYLVQEINSMKRLGWQSSSTQRPPVEDKTYQPVKLPDSPQMLRLRQLLDSGSPETLEAEVRSQVAILDRLVEPMSLLNKKPDATHWLQQIENVQKLNTIQKTIIGVVGNTGAGKSSVINAILDEERLVPTNCMRACTAVVTEMSWNDSKDVSNRYRADIEFIAIQDWAKELKILYEEIFDGNGKVSRECHSADTEASVAYAKIKAVYPHYTNDELSRSNVEKLLKDRSVNGILGTTKNIGESDPNVFYRELQKYVDSGEKDNKKKDKDVKPQVEFWPLIKVVRIFVKSDALSTGAVLVDLPGVHDSNAARSAIATNYLKQCTGLWIVAPINRAVDDKAAKNLLGESFKRQLKFDGTYSRVTFICSKTDDISVTEASDSLGLGTEMASKWENVDRLDEELKSHQEKLDDFRDSQAVYQSVADENDELLEVWEALEDSISNGDEVYAPRTSQSKKRKRSSQNGSRKKRATSTDSNDICDESDADDDSADEDAATTRGDPLTADVVEAKIAELKSNKKEARIAKAQLTKEVAELRQEIKVNRQQKKSIEAEMSAICISGRNHYSKSAIQADFAAGIKELDQENAAEEDEENFDPEKEIRDYDEVARSLPVFCVSSRAYQKLSGRLLRDNNVPRFTTLSETEVPQLQSHCKALTLNNRLAGCRKFINAFAALLNSMLFWATDDGTGSNLSGAEIMAESKLIRSKLDGLESGLEDAITDCHGRIKGSLAENIYEKFEEVIATAVAIANSTSSSWGAPVNKMDRTPGKGGLYWATYKAVTRRDGVYTSGTAGVIDFNSQLTEPIYKTLASDWEKVFARRLPVILTDLAQTLKQLISRFHVDVERRAYSRGTSIAGIAMLSQQLPIYQQTFEELQKQMVNMINDHQRDANRQFTPVVARSLASAYEYCAAERGGGQFQRMKSHMQAHVDSHKQTMFTDSTNEVKTALTNMCKTVEEEMMNQADEIFQKMQRDYLAVITGNQLQGGDTAAVTWTKTERTLKALVGRILDGSEPVNEPHHDEEPSQDVIVSDAEGVGQCDTEVAPVVANTVLSKPAIKAEIQGDSPVAGSTNAYTRSPTITRPPLEAVDLNICSTPAVNNTSSYLSTYSAYASENSTPSRKDNRWSHGRDASPEPTPFRKPDMSIFEAETDAHQSDARLAKPSKTSVEQPLLRSPVVKREEEQQIQQSPRKTTTSFTSARQTVHSMTPSSAPTSSRSSPAIAPLGSNPPSGIPQFLVDVVAELRQQFSLDSFDAIVHDGTLKIRCNDCRAWRGSDAKAVYKADSKGGAKAFARHLESGLHRSNAAQSRNVVIKREMSEVL